MGAKSTTNSGGDKRDRTADLLHAMQALSQLSYTPESLQLCSIMNDNCEELKLCRKFLICSSNF